MRIPSHGRFRRAVICLLTLCFLASLMPGGATAEPQMTVQVVEAEQVPPDAFEADNSMGTAKPITVGGAPQERTIHQPYDDDWVKFPARKGQTYVVESMYAREWERMGAIASDGVAGTYSDYPPAAVLLELYDSVGRRLSASDYYYSDARERSPREGALAAAAPCEKAATIQKGATVAEGRGHQMVTWKAPADMTAFVRVTYLYEDYEDSGLGQYMLAVNAVVPSISGRVTDPEGKPVSNVYVEAYPVDGGEPSSLVGGASHAEAWTDSDGEYVLSGLPAGLYEVSFEAPWWHRYRDEYYDNAYTEASATPVPVSGGLVGATGIDAQLEERPAQIFGRVVDEDGEPVPDICAYLYYWCPWCGTYHGYTNTYTDENGEYAFGDIYSYYSYKVVFYDWEHSPTRYASEGWDDTAEDPWSATAIPLTEEVWPDYLASPTSCDATLSAYPYVFSGTVTGPEGDPVPYADFELFDAAEGWYLGWGEADLNGDWVWTAGEEVTAKAYFYDDSWFQQYAGEWYDAAADHSSATTITGDPENPLTGIDVQLDYLPPSISGSVTDAETGAPLSGIQVWAYVYWSEMWMPYDVTMTDGSGGYTFQTIAYEDVALRFADPRGVYATEYFDNQPRITDADMLWAYPGSDVDADAALVKQGGRVFGGDRFATSCALAEEAYPGWTDVSDVVVASGLDAAAADALSSASLCWAYDAPLLLTHKDYTPPVLADALAEIMAANEGVRVHVVGGPTSVPDARLDELEAIVGEGNVERVPFGANRYDNAVKVSVEAERVAGDRGKSMPDFLFVANGSDFAKFFDALSASSISANTGAPVLLTRTDRVPAETATGIAHFEGFDVHVVGGPRTITNAVFAAVGADDRISGPDRYATSVALAQRALDDGWLQVDKIGIAARIPDALSGGVSVGSQGGPLLTTAGGFLPQVTYAFIDKYDQLIDGVVIFGGPKSVSAAVASQIALALEQ